MNLRAWQIRMTRLRGLPAILMVVLLSGLIVGILAVAVFVGLAVALLGLIASAVAAIFYALHWRLSRPRVVDGAPRKHTPALQDSGQVRDIKVDQIIVHKDL